MELVAAEMDRKTMSVKDILKEKLAGRINTIVGRRI